MESRPAQAVLPLVGLAADKVMRDRYISEPFLGHHNKATGVSTSPGVAR
ncbi:MAG: hypothetical protein R6U98_33545 [Pirellulaceae bacterium]